MSPRTGSIRKYQNSQSLMGVLPSLDSEQNLTLTSVGEVQLSTPPDKRKPPVYVLIRVSSLARCHGSNLFGTFPGNCHPWLLSRRHPSLVNVVDILTQEFESVVNIGKIDEEGCNIFPIGIRNSTQASRLRSAKRKRHLML
ncbi:hypothetical protein AVEN_139386-1 [Araneus ventricosus]|uniref:Uncharacterized protein n=1 Tax=Araneus ventricosus TaxID=182803 RepID=A0A4Y2GRA8_ARAVE|nr:hypothetical protein AVEN_139386-1 [Araneus ventricosus]